MENYLTAEELQDVRQIFLGNVDLQIVYDYTIIAERNILGSTDPATTISWEFSKIRKLIFYYAATGGSSSLKQSDNEK